MADIAFDEVATLPHRMADKTVKYGEGELQFAEYWVASDSSPLIVLIHGGCWLNAFDLTHARPLAAELAKRDFAVLSVEYRRIGDPGGAWPGTFDDIKAAMDLAVSLPHPELFVAGHSAGGHLALWVGGTYRHAKLKGVFGLAAISDLVQYARGSSTCQKATVKLMQGTPEERGENYRSASPSLLPVSVPTLLVHGTDDTIVDVNQSEQFCNVKRTTLRTLPGKGHFDLIDPRQTTPEILQRQIHQWLGG